MTHYGVGDVYGKYHAYYEHEIMYPYLITPEEIVITWQWFDIEEYLETHSSEEWVATFIQPSFDQHERLSLARWDELHPTFRMKSHFQYTPMLGDS